MAQDERDDDWESTALRLVANRVESLPARPGSGAESDLAEEDYGWEDTVIRRLRVWLSRDESSR